MMHSMLMRLDFHVPCMHELRATFGDQVQLREISIRVQQIDTKTKCISICCRMNLWFPNVCDQVRSEHHSSRNRYARFNAYAF